ncbi:MAG: DUF5103 domain-containing protein [Candidatus Symbiothrix sp.]|jgi:hypothetical protein|nr:DUF5103 domain-containing protein [Candidatus Symbiothrix sp.]
MKTINNIVETWRAASLLLLLGIATSLQAQPFRTEPFSERVQTLRVFPENQWDSAPVVGVENFQPLQNFQPLRMKTIDINFDVLGAAPNYLTYKIVHCNADWTLSDLFEHEYLDGLQNNPLLDYDNSLNTTMDYIHYQLKLPNEQVRLKLSGNYVVQIFEEGSEQPILNACFSVVEPQASVQMTVSPITDKGINNHFQAVNLVVGYRNEIRNPAQDLKVFVFQNNRQDNAARFVKPYLVQTGKAEYNHAPALIFDAGNEYRRFEMTTTQFAGLNIAAVNYHAPYYHTVLYPNGFRNNRAYDFTDDLNGKVYIRNIDAEDANTEADYQFVHFFLPCAQPLLEKVYILSGAFNNVLDKRSEMTYNASEGGYEKAVLLKEGYYNYLYVTQKNASEPASTAPIEGDFYQTDNEYRAMVYARPVGTRYDQLIGVQTVQYK